MASRYTKRACSSKGTNKIRNKALFHKRELFRASRFEYSFPYLPCNKIPTLCHRCSPGLSPKLICYVTGDVSQPPKELCEKYQGHMFRLLKPQYGLTDASSYWFSTYLKCFQDIGLQPQTSVSYFDQVSPGVRIMLLHATTAMKN
jgi:hypothetical protein